MNSQSVLTRATSSDLPKLLALIREFCAIDQHDFDEQRIRDSLPALLTGDDHGVVWLLGSPVGGYAVITWGYSLESGGREALIDEIYVQVRGQGLGKRAVTAILDDCRARGIKRVFLETETHNDRARRFYARAGFLSDDSIWMSLPLDNSGA